MAPEVGSSNPFPDKPSSSATERSEAESWLDSCLVLDHANDADDNLRISHSRDSNLRPTEDLSTKWIPLSPEFFPEESGKDQNEISPIKRELPRESEPGEFRTLDLADDKNPSSALDEDDLANIFRVWDLNTENPELERGTLTDILTSSLAESPSLSNDGVPAKLWNSSVLLSPPFEGAADLSLREMEKGMTETESMESLIASLSDLNISVNRRNGFEDSLC